MSTSRRPTPAERGHLASRQAPMSLSAATGRAGLQHAPGSDEVNADRVVWLSGQSSPHHHDLSPAQRALISGIPGFRPVLVGYPFTPTKTWRPTGLLTASWRNASQFRRLGDPTAARTIAERLTPLVEGRRTLLVCGSLGLELLLTALPALPRPHMVRVVALGPVASSLPSDIDLWVAQSRSDLISRCGYRGPVHHRPRCGHLGYARDPSVRAFVRAASQGRW